MEKRMAIEGMRCRSCKALIEGEVSGMDGVESISVSLEEGEAVVRLRQADIADIIEAIEKLGFTAKVR